MGNPCYRADGVRGVVRFSQPCVPRHRDPHCFWDTHIRRLARPHLAHNCRDRGRRARRCGLILAWPEVRTISSKDLAIPEPSRAPYARYSIFQELWRKQHFHRSIPRSFTRRGALGGRHDAHLNPVEELARSIIVDPSAVTAKLLSPKNDDLIVDMWYPFGIEPRGRSPRGAVKDDTVSEVPSEQLGKEVTNFRVQRPF
jgi:hypothetical protein